MPSAMPIDLDAPGAAVEIKAHTGRHPCRRVLVTVRFGGKWKERRFVPTATVRSVRRWAVGPHGFDLPAEAQLDHEVGVCDTGVIADRDARIGTLATRCRLRLDLAPREWFDS